jgi:hypothetical protein
MQRSGTISFVYRATIFQEMSTRAGGRELWVFGRLEDVVTGEPTGAPVLVGQLVAEALPALRPDGLLRFVAGRSFGRWQWDEDLVRLDPAQVAEFRRWLETNTKGAPRAREAAR